MEERDLGFPKVSGRVEGRLGVEDRDGTGVASGDMCDWEEGVTDEFRDFDRRLRLKEVGGVSGSYKRFKVNRNPYK